MLSRRLLRVKVIQSLYASLQKGETSITIAEQELWQGLSKSYELYYVSLSILVELRNFGLNRNEILKNKHLATVEEKNPNTRFVDNKVIKDLDGALRNLKQTYKFGNIFENHPEVISNLYKLVESSQVYKDFINLPEVDYEIEKKFLVKLIDKVIAQDLHLYSYFEDESVYWNDEAEFLFSMAMKTIKSFSESLGSRNALIEEFKDLEDKKFVDRLFRHSFNTSDEYRKLIASFAKNWEVERVSILDIIIMQTAINEVVEVAQVPVNVTLNEYIEIAKFYSSEKSGIFINGILDKIFLHLEEQKKIVKSGRGLISK